MTSVQDISALIATKTQIDRERIHVHEQEHHVTIGIAGCTENEKRFAETILRQNIPITLTWEVVHEDAPHLIPHYGLDALKATIAWFGRAPDTQLDKAFARRCAHFPEDASLEKTLEFLRNLRDECAFCAGASGFVMTWFNFLLDEYPEPDEVKVERRAKLNAKYGIEG